MFTGSGILDGTSKLGLTAHLIDSLVFCENSSHLTKIVYWPSVVGEAFDLAVDDIAWGHKTPIQHIYGHGPGWESGVAESRWEWNRFYPMQSRLPAVIWNCV
jgi:hypothetical protein